jgi:hypothetical protein
MTPETVDPEIAAMSIITTALTPLEPEAIRRVLKWAIERFQFRAPHEGTGAVGSAVVSAVASAVGASSATAVGASRTFLNLAELLDTAQPETGLDRVLTVAYYFQAVTGQEDWDAQAVNTELKHLGYPSTNITRDLDTLMMRSPRAVLQVRKGGTTRQARKRYRLTREGIRAVEGLIKIGDAGWHDLGVRATTGYGMDDRGGRPAPNRATEFAPDPVGKARPPKPRLPDEL